MLVSLVCGLVLSACQEENAVNPKKTGTLKLSLSAITIKASASGGRTKTVSTDSFIVRIYNVEEDEPVAVYDPWSSAPDSIELLTGEYYAEAVNIASPLAAAFNQPWYYGVSAQFSIDVEEVQVVTIECSLVNYKVAFQYSEALMNSFTSWSATATRAISGDSLIWVQGDNREGYFLTGEALNVHVHLAYQKAFEPEVEITRNFNVSIPSPNPATLYLLKVNAVLNNGQILINIDVDDSFTTVEIPVGDGG